MSVCSDGATLTMPVVPAGTACNTGNGGNGMFGGLGGFGGEGAWFIIILFLFAFLGFGNNNRGGFGGGGNSVPYIINAGGESSGSMQRSFDHSAVITKLDGITQGICDSTYALNNTITNGFSNAELSRCNQQAALMQQLNNMAMQAQNCCCETREAIQGVNYNLATQSCDTRNVIQNTTRDIIDNANQNSRAILDALNQNYIRTLESENQSLKLQASQANQNAVFGAKIDAATAELLRRTGHDCPTAAYVVQPPTPVNFPTNCCGPFNGGWGNGCGNCA